ncbi:MAG: hypothetical protein NTW14_08055 [bacterium]|nr:hypothetical protein [bacterium]
MCLILDVNFLSAAAESDKKPVSDWLFSDRIVGKMVVGGKLTEELEQFEKGIDLMRRLERRGRLRKENNLMVKNKTQELIDNNSCKSNDQHVIALAILSGARILCSFDKNLHSDFKDKKMIDQPRGRIYQNASHKDRIQRYGHTSACGVKKEN